MAEPKFKVGDAVEFQKDKATIAHLQSLFYSIDEDVGFLKRTFRVEEVKKTSRVADPDGWDVRILSSPGKVIWVSENHLQRA